MKFTAFIPLAAIALSTASTARADVAPDEFIGPVPAPIILNISDSLQRLDALVVKGEDLTQELDTLQGVISEIPTIASLRARLAAYVEQLSERARQTFVSESDAALLRQQFVRARLDFAFAELAERARGGGWSAEQYQTVVSQWIARARVFVDAPDPAVYQARLQSMLDTAYQNAVSAADIVMSMRIQMAKARLVEAQKDLARKAKDKVAIQQDYDRVVKLTLDRKILEADAGLDGGS